MPNLDDDRPGLAPMVVLVTLCGVLGGLFLVNSVAAWHRCAPGTFCGRATVEQQQASAALGACQEGCDRPAAEARVINADSTCMIQSCGDHHLSVFLLPGMMFLGAAGVICMHWVRMRNWQRSREPAPS